MGLQSHHLIETTLKRLSKLLVVPLVISELIYLLIRLFIYLGIQSVTVVERVRYMIVFMSLSFGLFYFVCSASLFQ